MYLKKLEIQGFKSFPHRTVLEFDRGISTIVGPNGCGKSNICDAIRWVLGEQSMKAIRGTRLEDIIFAGTQFKKPVGFAEVTLIIDNHDGALPLDYSEVSITRRFFRSGESEFMINKTTCRLKDIYNLFLDTGVGRDGYSIIGQGRIDEILSNRSEDRRKVFEEASGIMKYRVRKAESEKKLEGAGQNLIRIQDILLELKNMLDPLEEQSIRAKEYLFLRDELKSYEISHYLDQIGKAEERVRVTSALYEGSMEEKKTIEADLSLLRETRNQNEERINHIRSSNEDAKREFYDAQRDLERFMGERDFNLRKIAEIKNRIGEFLESFKGEENLLRVLEEKLVHSRARLDGLKAEIDTAADSHLGLKARAAGLTDEIESYDLELSKREIALNEKTTLLSDYRIRIGNLDGQISACSTQILRLNGELEDIDGKILREQDNYLNYGLQGDILNSKLKDSLSKLEDLIIKRREGERALTGEKEGKNILLNDKHRKNSEASLLKTMEENLEGYNYTTKAFLKHIHGQGLLQDEVKGALGQLIGVEKDYRTAVEVALGGAIHNIVTLNEDHARQAIEILKKHKMGRATFLPVSSIKASALPFSVANNLKKEKGFIAVAADLTTYDPLYSNIVHNFLGQVAIIDNLDSAIGIARKFNYGFRIVTLNGEMLSTRGAITGGSFDGKRTGILGRGDRISEILMEIDGINGKIEERDKRIRDLAEDIHTWGNEIDGIRDEIKGTESLKLKNENEKVNSSRIMGELKQRSVVLAQDRRSLEEQEAEHRGERDSYGGLAHGLTGEIARLKGDMDSFIKVHRDRIEKRDVLNDELTEIRININNLNNSKAVLEGEIGGIEEKIADAKRNLDDRIKQMESLKSDEEEIRAANGGLEKNIKTSGETKEGKELLIGSLSEELELLNSEISRSGGEIESLEERVRLLNDELNRLSIRKTRAEGDLENFSNRLWDDYELTYGNAAKYSRDDYTPVKAQREIAAIKEKIALLGPVNVNAIDEFIKTRDRYVFMEKQKTDLEEGERKLRVVIREMKELMEQQFIERFMVINENFNKVFNTLFHGGSARLKLSDPTDILNCNIDIEVRMPGKKMQDMMLLSGGERAFTAIALLFANLKLNPVSFCVLDEIESALDDANVVRFADFLKNMSSNTQFIVITHRKGTMEASDSIYGVTMEEKGVSKVVSMKMTN